MAELKLAKALYGMREVKRIVLNGAIARERSYFLPVVGHGREHDLVQWPDGTLEWLE